MKIEELRQIANEYLRNDRDNTLNRNWYGTVYDSTDKKIPVDNDPWKNQIPLED